MISMLETLVQVKFKLCQRLKFDKYSIGLLNPERKSIMLFMKV